MRVPGCFNAIVMVLLAFVPVTPAAAHPGGLNGEGCHNNRKTGGYHCHGGPGAAGSPRANISSSWKAASRSTVAISGSPAAAT